MQDIRMMVRHAALLSGVLALGYWLGSERPVKAAADTFEFQLAGVSQESSLLVYQPATKTVYVYRAVMTGGSNLQCSMKFVLSAPGAAIQRSNCDVGSLR